MTPELFFDGGGDALGAPHREKWRLLDRRGVERKPGSASADGVVVGGFGSVSLEVFFGLRPPFDVAGLQLGIFLA